jgi:hypothetical protein
MFLIPQGEEKSWKVAASADEVHRLAVGRVVEAALFFGLRTKDVGAAVVRMSGEEGHASVRVLERGGHGRPAARDCAKDGRTACREDVGAELLRRRRFPFGDSGRGFSS